MSPRFHAKNTENIAVHGLVYTLETVVVLRLLPGEQDLSDRPRRSRYTSLKFLNTHPPRSSNSASEAHTQCHFPSLYRTIRSQYLSASHHEGRHSLRELESDGSVLLHPGASPRPVLERTVPHRRHSGTRYPVSDGFLQHKQRCELRTRLDGLRDAGMRGIVAVDPDLEGRVVVEVEGHGRVLARNADRLEHFADQFGGRDAGLEGLSVWVLGAPASGPSEQISRR